MMVVWSEHSLKPGFIPRIAPMINSFAVSADGTRLFVACSDNAIRFIEVSQRSVVATLPGLALGSVRPSLSSSLGLSLETPAPVHPLRLDLRPPQAVHHPQHAFFPRSDPVLQSREG